MSIWGKVLGGAAGFALGGPLGALVGALAGHAVDRLRGGKREDGADGTKQIAFTIGVIVLGAKMAKADGVVTKDEIAAFKRIFQVPPDEARNVGRIFNQARRDARGFEPYAKQLGRMFKDNPAVLEELLGALFHIAKADGEVHPAELDYLANVARIFGFGAAHFDRVKAEYMGPDAADPYQILGVAREADDAAVKAAYRTLIRENHPDKLTAEGLPEEFIALANEKMAAINAAYDRIKKERDLT